jgi:hypothetical protein
MVKQQHQQESITQERKRERENRVIGSSGHLVIGLSETSHDRSADRRITQSLGFPITGSPDHQITGWSDDPISR